MEFAACRCVSHSTKPSSRSRINVFKLYTLLDSLVHYHLSLQPSWCNFIKKDEITTHLLPCILSQSHQPSTSKFDVPSLFSNSSRQRNSGILKSVRYIMYCLFWPPFQRAFLLFRHILDKLLPSHVTNADACSSTDWPSPFVSRKQKHRERKTKRSRGNSTLFVIETLSFYIKMYPFNNGKKFS